MELLELSWFVITHHGILEDTLSPVFFLFYFLLFIYAYKAWVISPPCPHPLPYHPLFV
jgi:hypothetical protein